MRRLALTVTVPVIFLFACRGEPVAPLAHGVEIVVDSAVYHLRPQSGGGWYEISMVVTVSNTSDETVYLSTNCGSWSLRRADENDKTPLILGEYACAIAGFPRSDPIVIAAHTSYSKPFKIIGSNSPLTQPPITIANNTGTLVFSYVFLTSDGTGATQLRSAPFGVVPPSE
jgi:hypothetical protein